MNQYRIITNKGEAYLAYAGDLGELTLLAGDAIQLALNAFLCPLNAIDKVEHETDSTTTVLYDRRGKGYTREDLTRLFYATRIN